jgi:hypothetical protein
LPRLAQRGTLPSTTTNGGAEHPQATRSGRLGAAVCSAANGRRAPAPSAPILDLRARVRLRHTLNEQRGEWQQRIQATLHHHGCPQRRALMVGNRARVAGRATAARHRA